MRVSGALPAKPLPQAGPAGRRAFAPRQYKDKSPRPNEDAETRSPKRFWYPTPRHVGMCFERWARDGQAHRAPWWICVWGVDCPVTGMRVPYRCQSWRCPWCARREAAVTFARIKEAVHRGEYAADGWVFFVLTLDRDGYYSGQPWPDVDTAFRELGKLSEKFRRRLERLSHAKGWEFNRSAWCAVVEAHRSGWPHVNVLLYQPELAAQLRREAESLDGRARVLVRGEIRALVVEAGWGRESTADAARSLDALAGYVSKLAGLGDATAGELAKVTQAPLRAPVRFRRLRSGRHFLPPRRHNPNVTGTLVRRQIDPEGTCTVVPLHKVRADQVPYVIAACLHEESLVYAEAERRHIIRRAPELAPLMPRPPPVVSFEFRGRLPAVSQRDTT